MSLMVFEPQLTSTPKRINATLFPHSYSTPRPFHNRYSLSKCMPLPIDSSTPIIGKNRKSFAPDINHLIYPSTISTIQSTKIWVL